MQVVKQNSEFGWWGLEAVFEAFLHRAVLVQNVKRFLKTVLKS